MPRIELENLSRAFVQPEGTVQLALDRVTMAVESGECVALVGPSGSGKTTLLRLIAGLDSPSSGTIRFDGGSVRDRGPGEREVGFVFQNSALYPHLTVRENLALSLELRGAARADVASAVDSMAERLELGALLTAYPETLSGGERQRVALGRALVARRSILLLDEPLASLDAPLRRQLREDVVRLHRELGTTLLYVTHDQQEALSLGGRVAVLCSGQLEQMGLPEEVYDRPATPFVATFIGQVPMNLLKGVWCRAGSTVRFELDPSLGGGAWPLEGEAWAGAPTGSRPAWLGLRAEHWRVTRAAPGTGPAIEGLVESVEFAGAERLLQVRAGLRPLRASAPRTEPWGSGQAVWLVPNLPSAVVFDAATGRRVDGRGSMG